MAISFRSLGDAVRRGLRLFGRPGQAGPARPDAARPSRSLQGAAAPAGTQARPYPGDFSGRTSIRYAPQPDGEPDPGEVVWAWVPYEEDHARGKDRPVLLVGRSGPYVLGLMLTSRDRVPASSSAGDYVDVGAGGWDRQGRPSEARLDRILQLRPGDIRREGAVLEREVFDRVAAALHRRHGWNQPGRGNGQASR
jgi:hypothetical protein